jgi:hypothetical protein
MLDDTTTFLSACGRTVSSEDVRHAQEVVRSCAGLSRSELALTLCEHWGWFGATGNPMVSACTKLLERLQAKGLLALPAKQKRRPTPGRASGPRIDKQGTAPGSLVETDLQGVRPVRLELVAGREETARWNGLLESHHPLGVKRSFGCTLRYSIKSARGLLGCLLMAGGARALRCRDEWIGWSAQQRLANLSLVVNNSRFLVFPWVRVPHLASHVLGLLARQLREDWHARWGFRPLLMETFVDPVQHRGVCYRAAGWVVLGETSGEGLRLRGHTYRTSRKLVLVRPLVRDFRAPLLSNPQPRSTSP